MLPPEMGRNRGRGKVLKGRTHSLAVMVSSICMVVRAFVVSHIRLCDPPGTVACQAPLSMWILQARILEWVSMPSFKGSSRPRDHTHVSYVSCTGRQVLYH